MVDEWGFLPQRHHEELMPHRCLKFLDLEKRVSTDS